MKRLLWIAITLVASLEDIPPAGGAYIPDKFDDPEDGQGFTWGLCHIMDKESGNNNSILARFDCDLSLDVDRQYFKRNNLRFNEQTYFQKGIALPPIIKQQIIRERKTLDRETIR